MWQSHQMRNMSPIHVRRLAIGVGFVMRHIPSGSEYVVPSTALKSFTPAWNSDGSMLAYVTAGTIENPADVASTAEKQRRNIYAFDQVKTGGRTDCCVANR